MSVGKTLVSTSIFSINSTFFRARGRSSRLIPVVRSAVLSRQVETPHALSPGMRTFAHGFGPDARAHLERVYLRWRGREIAALGRSVLRDLRIPVRPERLVELGWAKREAFYLSNRPNPLPPDPVRTGFEVPLGWRRLPVEGTRGERRKAMGSQQALLISLSQRAWVRECPTDRELSRLAWSLSTPGDLGSWRWWARASHGRGSRILYKSGFHLRIPISPIFSVPFRRRVWLAWSGAKRPRPGMATSADYCD